MSSQSRREVPDILSWIQCIGTYACIVAAVQPEKTQQLLAYQTMVVREARRCGSAGWQAYDTMFRQQVSNDPKSDWSKLNSSLYAVTFLAQQNGKGKGCLYCLETDHTAPECALAPSKPQQVQKEESKSAVPKFAIHGTMVGALSRIADTGTFVRSVKETTKHSIVEQEMTVPDDMAYDPSVHLSIKDISVDNSSNPSMCIKIKQSKTDPFRRGIDLFVGKTNSSLCPVTVVLNYLCTRGMETGPLFRFRDGKVLTRQRFVTAVKAGLDKAGIDSSKYSGYSFRIGAATTAAQNGMEDSIIKTLGRWESLAYLQYVKIPRKQLADYSSILAP